MGRPRALVGEEYDEGELVEDSRPDADRLARHFHLLRGLNAARDANMVRALSDAIDLYRVRQEPVPPMADVRETLRRVRRGRIPQGAPMHAVVRAYLDLEAFHGVDAYRRATADALSGRNAGRPADEAASDLMELCERLFVAAGRSSALQLTMFQRQVFAVARRVELSKIRLSQVRRYSGRK